MNKKIKYPITIWITGLSGSGKTTLANSLKKILFNSGISSIVLDGDYIRKTVNKDLNFSIDDREENNRRVAEIAHIINNEGIIVICSLISPSNAIRKKAENIIGRENFVLVYLNTPIHICESRDKKQLYKKARQGKISEFTGISSIFEEPVYPEIVLNGENSIDENLKHVIKILNQKYDLRVAVNSGKDEPEN